MGFLQQNAYHEIDTYVPLEKQLKMMELILKLYDGAKGLIARSIPLSQLKATGIFESLTKMKYEVPNDDPGQICPLRAGGRRRAGQGEPGKPVRTRGPPEPLPPRPGGRTGVLPALAGGGRPPPRISGVDSL